jgi:hypothetical protein
METVLLGFVVLACPVGMGLMMWLMAKGQRRERSGGGEETTVDDLRAEHARLTREIDRLQRR